MRIEVSNYIMGLAALLSGLIMALCVSHPHCHGNIKGFKSSHENSSLLKSHFHFLFLSLSAACTIFSQTLGSPIEICRANPSWQAGLTDSVPVHPMAPASGNRSQAQVNYNCLCFTFLFPSRR